ncbi:MAG TPA: YigZ family protein [Candidatus Mediterraneibacter norfolkensis]|nr:YigZ family protein [Candidatus Mediterraneibacter norfolkensis]
MKSFNTVHTGGQAEITEKKSRFIANVFPVSTEEEAFTRLEEIRKKYCDARHNCWAYVLGSDPPSERMSDDGEPAGTAGKPILEVIRGRALTDVLVVVTRYFGGTLLGTGGLVRAYTAAAAEGIGHSKIITRIYGFRLHITIDYADWGKIQYSLGKRNLSPEECSYTDKVELDILVSEDEEEGLKKDVMEGTNGQAEIKRVEECWFEKR